MKNEILQGIINVYEDEKSNVKKKDIYSAESNATKIDEKLKKLYLDYIDQKSTKIPLGESIPGIESYFKISKNDILIEINKKIKIFTALLKINSNLKIDSNEGDLIKNELISFGRQKNSIIDSKLGIEIAKILFEKSNSQDENIDSINKALKTIITPHDFWIYIRDTYSSYKTRDDIWTLLMSEYTQSFRDDLAKKLKIDFLKPRDHILFDKVYPSIDINEKQAIGLMRKILTV